LHFLRCPLLQSLSRVLSRSSPLLLSSLLMLLLLWQWPLLLQAQ
jgi:hypothetical protein